MEENNNKNIDRQEAVIAALAEFICTLLFCRQCFKKKKKEISTFYEIPGLSLAWTDGS